MLRQLSSLLPIAVTVLLSLTVWWASTPAAAPVGAPNPRGDHDELSAGSPADQAHESVGSNGASDPNAIGMVLVADPALVDGAGSNGETPVKAGPLRVAVVMVPGTWGSADFWPVVVEGQATFASEVVRAIHEDAGQVAEVFTHTGRLSNRHEDRMANAVRLAGMLDDLVDYDRVHVFAHSHGGNVALLAAGMTHTPIDTMFCLSTPHLTYRVRTADRQIHELPVYCSPEARANIKKLLTVTPSSDEVPTRFASLQNGLNEGDAHDLTASHRADLPAHRPAVGVDPIGDLLGELSAQLDGPGHDTNLRSDRSLISADHNLVFRSEAAGRFTIAAHNAVHSRRLGYLYGGMVRDGVTYEQIEYLQTLVQPADTDSGEPVDLTRWLEWHHSNEAAFDLIGWRVSNVRVDLHPDHSSAQQSGSNRPDLHVELRRSGSGDLLLRTVPVYNTTSAAWDTDLFISRDDTVEAVLFDADTLDRERIGRGRWFLNWEQRGLQRELSARLDEDIPWSLRLRFVKLHH